MFVHRKDPRGTVVVGHVDVELSFLLLVWRLVAAVVVVFGGCSR